MATTVRIPVDLRNPSVTASPGNAFWTVAGLTDWDGGHWEFVTSAEGRVFGTVMVPSNVAATSPLLWNIDSATGLPVTPNGGDITITVNAGGALDIG